MQEFAKTTFPLINSLIHSSTIALQLQCLLLKSEYLKLKIGDAVPLQQRAIKFIPYHKQFTTDLTYICMLS